MSSTVLARKYRPRNFESLVGQAHVVQALANALTQQRLHHAYLFTGTRGVGKTTIARILAKSLNCTGPDGSGGITAHPCGVCAACKRHRCRPLHRFRRARCGLEPRRRGDLAPARPVGLQAGRRPLQGLPDRRSAHALEPRLQRDAEDARGAARVPQVHPRHDRPAEGAGDGALALPAVQPAADGGGDDRRASRCDPRDRERRRRAGCAEADRARGPRLDARRAVAHRPGDRPRQRPGRGSGRAPDARRGRPQPRGSLHRGRGGARRRGADRRRRRSAQPRPVGVGCARGDGGAAAGDGGGPGGARRGRCRRPGRRGRRSARRAPARRRDPAPLQHGPRRPRRARARPRRVQRPGDGAAADARIRARRRTCRDAAAADTDVAAARCAGARGRDESRCRADGGAGRGTGSRLWQRRRQHRPGRHGRGSNRGQRRRRSLDARWCSA